MRLDTKLTYRVRYYANQDGSISLYATTDGRPGEKVGEIRFENVDDFKDCALAMLDLERPTWAKSFDISLHG